MSELKKTTTFGGAAMLLVALALLTVPPRAVPADFSDVGETFFPEFTDPETATTLEVVEFDEDTAAAAVFRVTNRNGLWTIPSHHDYPADGAERLANTAAGVMAITKDVFRSDNVTDHELFGVIDPLDQSVSTLRGRGRRVTFKGASEQVLADLIIGNRVEEGPPGYNFVRVPDQNRVYAARTDINISTRFNDWIETNLLGVERDDVKRTVLNEYQIDERTGAVRRRGEFIVDWVEDYEWTANDVPAGMEVDYVQMNLLVGGIMGLEIVGVRPKPEGLSGNLRQAFEARTITNADLQTMQSRGFYPTQAGDMLSNEGELLVRTEESVLYTLRFGEILYGSGNAIAIGDETSDDEETGVGENRYVLITAEFDPSGLPEPSRPSNRDFENKAEGQWTDADRENKERADLYAQWERRTETGQRRAEELSTRFAKWYYVISAGSYNRVHKTREDFLKEIEEEDEEPVEPPA